MKLPKCLAKVSLAGLILLPWLWFQKHKGKSSTIPQWQVGGKCERKSPRFSLFIWLHFRVFHNLRSSFSRNYMTCPLPKQFTNHKYVLRENWKGSKIITVGSWISFSFLMKNSKLFSQLFFSKWRKMFQRANLNLLKELLSLGMYFDGLGVHYMSANQFTRTVF